MAVLAGALEVLSQQFYLFIVLPERSEAPLVS